MTEPKERPLAFFIPALNGGGAQRVVVNLANAFCELTDRPVHVVLVRKTGAFLSDLRPNVRVVDLGAGSTLFSLPRLALYFARQRPEVVMSTLRYANVICILAWVLSLRRSRLIIREANVVVLSLKMPIKERIVVSLMRVLYPLVERVIANSEDTALSLLNAGMKPRRGIVVLPNPVMTAGYSPPVPRASDLVRLVPTLPSGTRFICSVGRLAWQKGFDILLMSFSQVCDPDLHLVIVGQGPEERIIRRLCAELGLESRVHLPGFVSCPERVMARSSGFVLASRWEGFGNVIVEALALGLPVVATDCPGGPGHILNHGEFGILVSVDDAASLADGIERMLTNPPATPATRRKRAQDFSVERVAPAYLRVLLPKPMA